MNAIKKFLKYASFIIVNVGCHDNIIKKIDSNDELKQNTSNGKAKGRSDPNNEIFLKYSSQNEQTLNDQPDLINLLNLVLSNISERNISEENIKEESISKENISEEQEQLVKSVRNIFYDANGEYYNSIAEDLNFIYYTTSDNIKKRINKEISSLEQSILNSPTLEEIASYNGGNKILHSYEESKNANTLFNVSRENKVLGYVTFNSNTNYGGSITDAIYGIYGSPRENDDEWDRVLDQYVDAKEQYQHTGTETNFLNLDKKKKAYLHFAQYKKYDGELVEKNIRPTIDGTLYIEILVVDKEKRKAGYGTELINNLEKIAKSSGKRYLLLYTWDKEDEKNFSAYQFYIHKQFKVLFKQVNESGKKTVYMCKDLEETSN